MQVRYLKKNEKQIQGICKIYLKLERDAYAGRIQKQIKSHMQGICKAYQKMERDAYAGYIKKDWRHVQDISKNGTRCMCRAYLPPRAKKC